MRRRHLPSVLVAVLLAVLLSPGSAWAEVCDGTWRVAPPPASPTPQPYTLADVAVISSGELWAVGETTDAEGREVAVIAHRGTAGRWRRSHTFPGLHLVSIAARPGAVWAVGTRADGTGIALRSDGDTWRTARTAPTGWRLTKVAMSSPSDVWISVWATTPDGYRAAALHYDGQGWQRHVMPDAGWATAVDVDGRGGVWLMGLAYDGSRGGPVTSWHWTGRGPWRVEHGPDRYAANAFTVNAVAAQADGTIWAAGSWPVGNCCDEYWGSLRHAQDGWFALPGLYADGAGDGVARDVSAGGRGYPPTVVGDLSWYIDEGVPGPGWIKSRVGGTWVDQEVRGLTVVDALTGIDGDGHGGAWVVGSSAGRPVTAHRCGSAT